MSQSWPNQHTPNCAPNNQRKHTKPDRPRKTANKPKNRWHTEQHSFNHNAIKLKPTLGANSPRITCTSAHLAKMSRRVSFVLDHLVEDACIDSHSERQMVTSSGAKGESAYHNGSQPGPVLPTRRYLTTSRDTFGGYNWERRCCWHPVGRGQRSYILHCTGQVPHNWLSSPKRPQW